MCESYTNKDCIACHAPGPIRPEGRYVSFAGNLLLVVMPKCSFCVLAYTSTAVLCTREETLISTSLHSSPLTISLTLGLCGLILASILLNRRGKRSGYALVLAVIGMAMMTVSVLKGGGAPLYYAGNLVVFLSIAVQGGLDFIWQKMKQSLVFTRLK